MRTQVTRRRVLGWVTGFALLGGLGSFALGKTNYVSTTGSDSAGTGADWANAWGSISNAVVQAEANDMILVSNGVYTVTTNIVVDKAVTISGYPPNTNTIVTRASTTTNRLFRITHAGAVVEYLAITNGNPNTYGGGTWQTGGGGAVWMSGGTLRNCFIAKNKFTIWSGIGGGVYAEGNSTVSNCVIQDNSFVNGSYGAGIGIYNNGANVRIVDCVISSNGIAGSAYGGGIYMLAGIVKRCTLIANRANEYNGGNVQIAGGVLEDCTLEGGDAVYSSGGSIHLTGGIVSNCVIRNAKAARSGGGGVCMTAGLMVGCTITNNKPVAWACYKGGGLWIKGGKALNTLIAGNVLSDDGVAKGAGVYMEGGQLQSCTIASNACLLTRTGGGIQYVSGAISNCIIYGNTTAVVGDDDNLAGTGVADACWYSCSTGLVEGVNSNLTVNPLFVGGGDYHLQSRYGRWTPSGWTNDSVNSPCIDQGPPGWDCSLEPEANGGRINMGAYGNTEQASKSKDPAHGTVILLL